jgi:putative DNA primase/helicase
MAEGQKAQEALAGIDIQAVGTVTGAANIPGDEALKPLISKIVYLWPDNDADGRNHMHKIAARLASMGCQRLYMVKWDDGPPKGDAADYVARGATKADVWALLKASRVWNPGAEPEPRKAEPEKPAGPVLRVVRMQDVIAKPVDWLWERWLARGKVTIIGGHAGDGKSMLTAWLAATLSNGGKWPDWTRAPKGRTLFLLAEDGLEGTLRPRLDQHGADVSQVFAIQAVQEPHGHDSAFSIARHLDLLEERIIEEGIDLLVIDPITSFMPKSDRNTEGDVRDLLTPLTALADRTDVAVTPVMHVGKLTGTNRRPVQQLLGATAFSAIARSGWSRRPPTNPTKPDECSPW